MQAFLSKGRMQALLEAIPVHVIRNEKTGLLGAACYGACLADRKANETTNKVAKHVAENSVV
jgi:hypothetical protein